MTIGSGELVGHAIEKMKKFNISQIPVIKDEQIAGFVDETRLYQSIVEDRNNVDKRIELLMGPPLPVVAENDPIEKVSSLMNKEVPAVLVKMDNGKFQIITKYDVIQGMS